MRAELSTRDRRKRLIVGRLLIGVAAVLATTLNLGVPSSATEVAHLFVVALAPFLAGVSLFDSWNVVSDPFRQADRDRPGGAAPTARPNRENELLNRQPTRSRSVVGG